MKKSFVTMALLGASLAFAAPVGTSTAVPVTAVTQSACQFDTANSSPTIDLPDYAAAEATTYTGELAQVSISVYCNAGTPLTARTIGGSSAAVNIATAVPVVLRKDGVINAPAINALVWYTAGSSNTVTSGTFQGARRYVSVIRAGWPTQAQFSAPTGFYSGTVDFTVEF